MCQSTIAISKSIRRFFTNGRKTWNSSTKKFGFFLALSWQNHLKFGRRFGGPISFLWTNSNYCREMMYLRISANPQITKKTRSVKQKPATCHSCGRSADKRKFFVCKFADLRFAELQSLRRTPSFATPYNERYKRRYVLRFSLDSAITPYLSFYHGLGHILVKSRLCFSTHVLVKNTWDQLKIS